MWRTCAGDALGGQREVQHVVHGPLEMLVQGPLGVDERLRRLPGDPLGQGECLVKARPVGHHPVRQPEFHGVLGDDAIAGEQILLGPQKARHGWPRQGTTVGRHQAHRDVRVGQVGALLNQDDIAEPGQGTAEPDGRAVHGGDHREPEPDEPLHDLARLAQDGRPDLLVFVHPLEEGHVTTATERPPVAGDHDHRAAGIPLQLQPDLGQTAVELRVGGIQGLGPVQPDDPDAITALDEKDGVRLAHAHDATRTISRCRCHNGGMDALYRPQFLPDLLIAALERNGDRPCLYIDGDVLTAAQMRDQISRYAQAFGAQGILLGQGVATLSKNRPEVLFSMGAVMVTGCRNTPLHPLGSLDDHAYVLEDAQINTLIFDPAFAGRAQELQEKVPTLTRLLSYGPSDVGEDLMKLSEAFEPRRLVGPDVGPEDVSALAYTGGTTGKPKGVMNTFRASASMTQIQMSEWQWPDEVRHLVCTPLSHAGSSFFVPILLAGGSMVVLPAFEPAAVLEAIEEHRITTTMLVPSMIYSLLDHPTFAERDLSSLKTIYYGASPMSPIRLQEAIRKLGLIFFQFYGQTEGPMTVCVLRKEEHDPDDLNRLASCGRPVPWTRVGLLDDEGHEVADGEPGELCVRGPLVMKGYWNKPEETAEALEGGWLHTGDVARKDEQGFLTIVDRKKDMIVSGGFNVFPREIEDIIATHPSVSAVAVVGTPDDKWGEAVTAVIVPRAGATVDVDAIVALVKERKGSHHAPKTVDIVDAIPVSPLGKPDKKAIRARYWAGSDRLVH